MTTQTQASTLDGYNPFVVATTELCSEKAFLFYRQVFLNVSYDMDAKSKLTAMWFWGLACQIVTSSGQLGLRTAKKARENISSTAKASWPNVYGWLSQSLRSARGFISQAPVDQDLVSPRDESGDELDPPVEQLREEAAEDSSHALELTAIELQELGVIQLREIAAEFNIRVPGVRPSKTTKPQLLERLEPLAKLS